MDDDAPTENPLADFNKIDLTQLQGFSFGTQWTQDKGSPASSPHGRSDRGRRDDRPDGPAGAPDRRDRRAFRKPPLDPAGPGGGPSAPPDGGGPRRDSAGDRPPQRREQAGDFRGGPRRGGYAAERPERERGPYDSPYFAVVFYPEDASFGALVKTIRTSARTIELFEIARTVLGKAERFVVVANRKSAGENSPGGPPSGAVHTGAQPLYVSILDGIPFETEEAALTHVMGRHLPAFFGLAEVEIDPPKGNYQVINKCGVTGELLGPPNYHRYGQIIQQHHAAKGARLPFEAFRARIETIRDPEVVKQWLDKMRKVTRYTWKQEPAPAGASAPTDAAPSAETPAQISFDSFDDAREYLLAHARDKVIKAVESVRLHGKLIETMPQGEIRRAIEGALERQRRFPLDTANVLRSRLRREHFTIFKKGSKGVSYVCAVKRKFRVPGQVFAESIGALISFIETHPMVKAAELASKFLGVIPPAGESPVPGPAEREKIARMQGDLVWLVREGYVTEFIDGTLYAPPATVEALKKEVEAAEHDPENFPEAPSASPAEAPPDLPPPDLAGAVPESSAGATAEEPAPAAVEEELPPAPEPASPDGASVSAAPQKT